MIDEDDLMALLACVEHDERLYDLMLEVLANQTVCEEIKEAYGKLLKENQDVKRTK